MADLAAEQVVRALQVLLRAGSTVPDDDIQIGRAWPVSRYPALRLVAGPESIEVDDDATWPATREHDLQVDVEGHVQATTDVDSAMNVLALDTLRVIEGSLNAARLAPLNCMVRCAEIRRVRQTDGEASIGRVTLRLQVTYVVNANAPDVIL